MRQRSTAGMGTAAMSNPVRKASPPRSSGFHVDTSAGKGDAFQAGRPAPGHAADKWERGETAGRKAEPTGKTKGQQHKGEANPITVQQVLQKVADDKIGTPIAPSDAAAIQAAEEAASGRGGIGEGAVKMAQRNVRVGVVVPGTAPGERGEVGGWAVEITKAPYASPYTIGDALQHVEEAHVGEGVAVTRAKAQQVQSAEADASPMGVVEKGGVAAHFQAAADKNAETGGSAGA